MNAWLGCGISGLFELGPRYTHLICSGISAVFNAFSIEFRGLSRKYLIWPDALWVVYAGESCSSYIVWSIRLVGIFPGNVNDEFELWPVNQFSVFKIKS